MLPLWAVYKGRFQLYNNRKRKIGCFLARIYI